MFSSISERRVILLLVAEFLADVAQFVADDPGDPFRTRQDVEQVQDLLDDFLVLLDDLFLLEAGQPLQTHLQDLARLRVREPISAVVLQARRPASTLSGRSEVGVPRGALSTIADGDAGGPGALEQAFLGDRRRRRCLDQRDHLVDVGDRDRKSFQQMATLTGLAQLEDRTPGQHFAPMRQRNDSMHLLQIQQPRLAVDQRDHVDAEGVLQLRLLVEVVQDHVGVLAALELDHDPHALLVGFVADVRDALDLLLVHQFRDALLQDRLVHLVGDLVDDDRLPIAAFHVLEMGLARASPPGPRPVR